MILASVSLLMVTSTAVFTPSIEGATVNKWLVSYKTQADLSPSPSTLAFSKTIDQLLDESESLFFGVQFPEPERNVLGIGIELVPDELQTATEIATRHGVPVLGNYDSAGVFYTDATPTQVLAMLQDPNVLAVTADNPVLPCQASIARNTPTPSFRTGSRGSEWGLDRLDQQSWPKNFSSAITAVIGPDQGGTLTTTNQGEGVDVFILDMGLESTNPELQNSVVLDAQFFGGTGAGQFQSFHHGTQVATLVGGETLGVATKARLRSVKVGHQDRSSERAIIEGIDWVIKNGVKGKSVINLSWSSPGGVGSAGWRAVGRAVDAGIVVVVAAGQGNPGGNASSNGYCHPNAIVAGALQVNDVVWGGSNWGSLVDVFAPGNEVMVRLSNYQNTGNFTHSFFMVNGTSYATGYTSGVVAQILSNYHRALNLTSVAERWHLSRWLRQRRLPMPDVSGAPAWAHLVLNSYATNNQIPVGNLQSRPGSPNRILHVVPRFPFL